MAEYPPGGLVVPITVAVEVDYLVRSRRGEAAGRSFLDDVAAGRYTLYPVQGDVFARAVELDARFADAGLGLVDASVIAVAEALEATTVLTLDHSHFRLAGGPDWVLLPDEATLAP